MAPALPTTSPVSTAPTALAPAKLGNFRHGEDRDSDASDSDQSDASGRSLSPTRQGLSKTKKRKERRQFGAFADELGDLLGAAFQSKDRPKPTGLAASTHAGTQEMDKTVERTTPMPPALPSKGQQFAGYLTLHIANPTMSGDLEMQVESTSSEPNMSKRQRQNLAKMQARKLAKEQSKMVTAEQQTVAAERRGMTIQEYRGQKPPGKKNGKSESQKRRSRKERERLKKKAEQAGAMEID